MASHFPSSATRSLMGAFFLVLLVVFSASLGCSGGSETTVASNDPAPLPEPEPAPRPEPEPEKAPEPKDEGYGSEEYTATAKKSESQSGGGGYEEQYNSGGSYGDSEGSDPEGSMNGDYGDSYGDDYGGGMEGGGMAAGGMGGYDEGYSESNGMGGGGTAAEGLFGGGGGPGPGMGGGMGRPQADPETQLAMGFVRQNCFTCHGSRQQKGGINLEMLTADFQNPNNVGLWKQAVAQVKSGAMPPASARQPEAAQKAMLVSFVERSIKDSGIDSQDYLDRAKFAFASGQPSEATDMLFAHALAASEDRTSELLNQVRWGYVAATDGYALPPRPRFSMRFAVGVELDLTPATLKDVSPIGSGSGGGGGMSGMLGGDEYGGGMGGGSRRNAPSGSKTLDALTGDVGSAVVNSFMGRWTDGSLGSVFSDVTVRERRPAPRPGAGPGGPGGGAGGMGSMMQGMGGGGAGAAGMGGYDEGYDGGAGSSNMGAEGLGGMGGMMGAGGGDGAAEIPSMRSNINPGDTVTPGLVYVGTGKQSELIEKAKEQGVDAIFVFDVEATENRRTKSVINKTKVRLITLEGKVIGSTPTLANNEVERKRERSGEDDVVKAVDRLFAAVDSKIKMVDMPDFKPEHAMGRLQSLIAKREALPEDEEESMNLQILYEARLFHSMNLLDQEQAATVYQVVLGGNEGLVLANGNVDDRRLVIQQILGETEE